MESNRQQKINRLIQKELVRSSCWRQEDAGCLHLGNQRGVSPDLGIAHAYLSIFPSEKSEILITNINDNVKSLRYDLGKRVGKQLRVIPELTFHLDDSLDYIENIDRLLKND